MADIDTSRDIQTTGVKHLEPNSTGKVIRVVFTTKSGDKAFQIPTDAVSVLLPFLAKAAQEGRRISGEESLKTVFPIQTGEVGVTEQGQVLFDFVLPEGAEFAFQMDRNSASVLLTALQQVLAPSDEPRMAPKPH